jgi:hypothetical protein
MGAAIAIAVGVWWTANTVSHLFIHRPFFGWRSANGCVAALLTAALGFPQSLWRDRHLAHHRGVPYRFRVTRDIALQSGVVAAIWIAMALAAPKFFALVYLPGYLLGLVLCAIHGHYEHAGGTTSHYGRLYNALCFNDGYHVEHHRHPSAAWSTLPRCRESSSPGSAWPAPLRWLELTRVLAALERVVLRSAALQRWVVRAHEQTFEQLLAGEAPRDVAIVGGGLFPRTALVLRRLLPHARLTIVDANQANLERARAFLEDDAIGFVHARFTHFPCDLLVFPLSYEGDRAAVYDRPAARSVLVHDWIWRKRGTSRIVSLLLLKRLNLVRGGVS